MAELLYDPVSPDMLRDPHPYFRRLRDEAPVFHFKDSDKDFYVLSRFEDIFRAARAPEVFSSASGLTFNDDEISQKLLDAGFSKIARRTVAKYRGIMNIPTARFRKKYE